MINGLVLGATGQLARNTVPVLRRHPDVALTRFLRRAGRLGNPEPDRVTSKPRLNLR